MKTKTTVTAPGVAPANIEILSPFVLRASQLGEMAFLEGRPAHPPESFRGLIAEAWLEGYQQAKTVTRLERL